MPPQFGLHPLGVTATLTEQFGGGGMYDHDQLFKELLKEFFPDFFRLFFPVWAEQFDFTQVEWLDKEVFPDPPQGERRTLDLLAKLPCRVPPVTGKESGPWLALIHIEVESPESVAAFRPRMFAYFGHVRAKHNLPVLPIALYLRVGLEGIGWDVYEERFWNQVLVQFHYPYVGLPALNAVQYLHGENYLGVGLIGLMKRALEQAAEMKAEGYGRIASSPLTKQQKYLLGSCLEAYMPLVGPTLEQFEQLILSEKYPGAQAMSQNTLEIIANKGRRSMLERQLQKRFGLVSNAVKEKLLSMSAEELEALGEALVTASSLQELGLEPSANPDSA
jgi:hypothetical protein